MKGNKNYFELARVNYSNWLCSAMFQLARVRTIGMTRRFDFAPGFHTIGTKFYRPHKVSLLHMPFF